MKSKVGFVLLFFFSVACARLDVATKDPLKVDINMRVDVYQHVVKDVESINDQIYGTQDESKNLNFLPLVQNAYAADVPSEVEEAIKNRKKRADKITEYFSKGYIGENRQALLEVAGVDKDIPSDLKAEIKKLVDEENDDRQVIYEYTAKKNGIDIEEARKIFYKDDYKRAPSGSWFEVYQNGEFLWQRK
ncbi:MAG: DUF1318 domain-containing protein [Candidatus Omnitrophica bacterium]|nr:DUF1318 domain-containing protein [Candidatus Omnitrophota bacterium]MBD3268664.1 DUF1318 domain-containing protein [Candidatus Omnitrophota bacterium]